MTGIAADSADRQGWIVALALALALLLGGGGSPAPAPEIILQIGFAALFAAWVWQAPGPVWPNNSRGARTIALLALAVPVVQLVPLPPAVWQALPGRELEREALALIGQERTWRPLSLAPARTLASFLAMTPAAAMLVMVAGLNRRGRARIIAAIAGFALLTLLMGAAQLSGGTSSPLYVYGADAAILTGFQANRNSTADILLIGMIAAPAAIRRIARQRRPAPHRAAVLLWAAGAFALLGLGVVLTQSRTGAVLIGIALIANLAILRPWLTASPRAAAAAVLALAVLAAAAWQSPAFGRLADRFAMTQDARPEVWRDSLHVAGQHAPVGVGMGGFVPAYIAGERLEAVGQTVPNRAHNDYLELAIEAGIPGLVVLVLSGAIVLAAASRRLRQPAGDEVHTELLFAAFSLGIGALHSLVDYPLRSMALACLVAACAGLVFPAGTTDDGDTGRHRTSA